MPLERVLDIMLAGTNYTWTKTPDYYLVSTMNVANTAFIPGTVTASYKMTYITAEAAVAMLSTAFNQFVRFEPNGHLVTITAGPAYVERIINDLKSFDMIRPQVLLKSRVVVMEEGDLLNMGIEWSWPQMSAGLFSTDYRGQIDSDFDSGGKGIWGVQLGYSLGNTFTKALTMGLNLLQENDKAQMIASPSAMAQDGHLSEMSVITEEYFMLTPQNDGIATFSQSQMEMIESGVKLSITPYIGTEEDIMMDIAVELSDSIPSGRGSGLPVVTRRTSSGRVTVKDGGSAVIAGLNENRRNINEKSTPGLSRIPLLGKLFDNTTKDVASRDVAIFVTANIVRPGTGNITQPKPVVEAPKEPLMGDGMFNNTSTMNDLNAMANTPAARPLDTSINASPPARYRNEKSEKAGFIADPAFFS
jgi:type II secretory pathway component GspD/PulD (secretin)